jgi:hypothetical protein
MLGLIPILAVAAAASSVNVPATLGGNVAKAKSQSGLEVFIPDRIPGAGTNKVYPDLDASQGSYTLHLGLAKNCGGAGACYLAYFTGEDGGKLYGNKRVSLHDGIKGRFARSTCGANCSAPVMSWKVDGVAYSVAVKSVAGKEKRKMTAIANQAIDAGPR